MPRRDLAQPKTNRFRGYSTMTLVQLLQARWIRGPYTRFDSFVIEVANANRKIAEAIREEWLDQGILAYDSSGYLVWRRPLREVSTCP